jgi:lipoprotein-releasing system permease protein
MEVSYADKTLYENINIISQTKKRLLKKDNSVIKRNKTLKGIQVIGVNANEKLSLREISGEYDFSDSEKLIGLGVSLAREFGVSVGNVVEILYENAKGKPKMQKFEVSFIYEVGMSAYDGNTAIINIKDSEELFPNSLYIHGIDILDPIDMAAAEKELTKELLRLDVDCKSNSKCFTTWQTKNRNLMEALKTERVVMALILAIVIIIALTNLATTLFVSAKDKVNAISIMKTLGAKAKDIKKIFFYQGLIIGTTGANIGLALGVLLSLNLETIILFFEGLFGEKIMNPEVYYISTIKATMEPSQILFFYISILVISAVITIFPSLSAAKMDMLEGIKK